MPNITRKVDPKSVQEKKILSELRRRMSLSQQKLNTMYDSWRRAEEEATVYIHERDVDKARKADRDGGVPQYTTLHVPYSYAVMLSMHTYFTSVFLARSPTFQFSGRHGETMQQTQAIEAVIDYQLGVGEMMPVLFSWLYDPGKYGAGIVGTYWDHQIEQITRISEKPVMDLLGQPTEQKQKVQETVRLTKYKGNRIYNIQPWDFFFDARVPLRDFQKGEFCGIRRKVGWNFLKRMEQAGYYYGLDRLTSSHEFTGENTEDGAPSLNRPDSLSQSTSFDSHGDSNKNPSMVGIYEIYVELCPKDWELGGSDWPEKWVFTCTQDYSVLLGVMPLGAYHCKFPFNVLLTDPEAYTLFPRSVTETLQPIQQTLDWLLNSHFYNVRAALNNKYVIDPSRVIMKDLLNPLPGGIVRLKPSAYGSDPRLALSQLPITDVTQNHLRDFQMMIGVGERTVGVNDQIMGMLSTGGRKTATEVRTSTSFGVNRLKTVTEYFSVTGFDPLARMLVTNTQQYYDAPMQFRIAGDLLNGAGAQYLMVDPATIAGEFSFVPVDGSLPIDRFAQANLWKELMMQMRSFPELTQTYDMGRIFEWVAQLAGLKNISQFKVQVMPPGMAPPPGMIPSPVGPPPGGAPQSSRTFGPSPASPQVTNPANMGG